MNDRGPEAKAEPAGGRAWHGHSGPLTVPGAYFNFTLNHGNPAELRGFHRLTALMATAVSSATNSASTFTITPQLGEIFPFSDHGLERDDGRLVNLCQGSEATVGGAVSTVELLGDVYAVVLAYLVGPLMARDICGRPVTAAHDDVVETLVVLRQLDYRHYRVVTPILWQLRSVYREMRVGPGRAWMRAEPAYWRGAATIFEATARGAPPPAQFVGRAREINALHFFRVFMWQRRRAFRFRFGGGPVSPADVIIMFDGCRGAAAALSVYRIDAPRPFLGPLDQAAMNPATLPRRGGAIVGGEVTVPMFLGSRRRAADAQRTWCERPRPMRLADRTFLAAIEEGVQAGYADWERLYQRQPNGDEKTIEGPVTARTGPYSWYGTAGKPVPRLWQPTVWSGIAGAAGTGRNAKGDGPDVGTACNGINELWWIGRALHHVLEFVFGPDDDRDVQAIVRLRHLDSAFYGYCIRLLTNLTLPDPDGWSRADRVPYTWRYTMNVVEDYNTRVGCHHQCRCHEGRQLVGFTGGPPQMQPLFGVIHTPPSFIEELLLRSDVGWLPVQVPETPYDRALRPPARHGHVTMMTAVSVRRDRRRRPGAAGTARNAKGDGPGRRKWKQLKRRGEEESPPEEAEQPAPETVEHPPPHRQGNVLRIDAQGEAALVPKTPVDAIVHSVTRSTIGDKTYKDILLEVRDFGTAVREWPETWRRRQNVKFLVDNVRFRQRWAREVLAKGDVVKCVPTRLTQDCKILLCEVTEIVSFTDAPAWRLPEPVQAPGSGDAPGDLPTQGDGAEEPDQRPPEPESDGAGNSEGGPPGAQQPPPQQNTDHHAQPRGSPHSGGPPNGPHGKGGATPPPPPPPPVGTGPTARMRLNGVAISRWRGPSDPTTGQAAKPIHRDVQPGPLLQSRHVVNRGTDADDTIDVRPFMDRLMRSLVRAQAYAGDAGRLSQRSNLFYLRCAGTRVRDRRTNFKDMAQLFEDCQGAHCLELDKFLTRVEDIIRGPVFERDPSQTGWSIACDLGVVAEGPVMRRPASRGDFVTRYHENQALFMFELLKERGFGQRAADATDQLDVPRSSEEEAIRDLFDVLPPGHDPGDDHKPDPEEVLKSTILEFDAYEQVCRGCLESQEMEDLRVCDWPIARPRTYVVPGVPKVNYWWRASQEECMAEMINDFHVVADHLYRTIFDMHEGWAHVLIDATYARAHIIQEAQFELGQLRGRNAIVDAQHVAFRDIWSKAQNGWERVVRTIHAEGLMQDYPFLPRDKFNRIGGQMDDEVRSDLARVYVSFFDSAALVCSLRVRVAVGPFSARTLARSACHITMGHFASARLAARRKDSGHHRRVPAWYLAMCGLLLHLLRVQYAVDAQRDDFFDAVVVAWDSLGERQREALAPVDIVSDAVAVAYSKEPEPGLVEERVPAPWRDLFCPASDDLPYLCHVDAESFALFEIVEPLDSHGAASNPTWKYNDAEIPWVQMVSNVLEDMTKDIGCWQEFVAHCDAERGLELGAMGVVLPNPVALAPIVAAPPGPVLVPGPGPVKPTSALCPRGMQVWEDVSNNCVGYAVDVLTDYARFCGASERFNTTLGWWWARMVTPKTLAGFFKMFVHRTACCPTGLVVTIAGISSWWPIEAVQAYDEIGTTADNILSTRTNIGEIRTLQLDAVLHVTLPHWGASVGHIAVWLPVAYTPTSRFDSWNREIGDWLLKRFPSLGVFTRGGRSLIARRNYAVIRRCGTRTATIPIGQVVVIRRGTLFRSIGIDVYDATFERHYRMCCTTAKVVQNVDGSTEIHVRGIHALSTAGGGPEDFETFPRIAGNPSHYDPYPVRTVLDCVCGHDCLAEQTAEFTAVGLRASGLGGTEPMRYRTTVTNPFAPAAVLVGAAQMAARQEMGLVLRNRESATMTVARFHDGMAFSAAHARAVSLCGRGHHFVESYTKSQFTRDFDWLFTRTRQHGRHCACGSLIPASSMHCPMCDQRRICVRCGQYKSVIGACATCPIRTIDGGWRVPDAAASALVQAFWNVDQMTMAVRCQPGYRRGDFGDGWLSTAPFVVPTTLGYGKTPRPPPREFRTNVYPVFGMYKRRKGAEAAGFIPSAFWPFVAQESVPGYITSCGSRMTTSLDPKFTPAWRRFYTRVAKAFAEVITASPDGRTNDFRLSIPKWGTPAFQIALFEATDSMPPEKRDAYRNLYRVMCEDSQPLQRKDFSCSVFMKREIKSGFEETQWLGDKGPTETAPDGTEGDVWRRTDLPRLDAEAGTLHNSDFLTTNRLIADFHSRRLAVVEIVTVHTLTRFLHKVLGPHGPNGFCRRFVYLCGGNPVTIGAALQEFVEQHAFHAVQEADFSKFDSRQRDACFSAAMLFQGIIAPSAYDDPLTAEVLRKLSNPRYVMDFKCKGPGQRGFNRVGGKRCKPAFGGPAYGVKGPASIESGFIGTSLGGTMRNLIHNLCQLIVSVVGEAQALAAPISPAYLEMIVARADFGIAVLGDDQLRFAGSLDVLGRMNAAAPLFNQKCTGGDPRPIDHIAECSILGCRLVTYRVNGKNQWVLDQDLARVLGKSGWCLHDSIPAPVWKWLVARSALVLTPDKPILGHVFKREIQLLEHHSADLIRTFVRRTLATNQRTAPDPDLSAWFSAWIAKPRNLLALQAMIDPDFAYKHWRRLPRAMAHPEVVPETWRDLAIAYADGDEARFRQCDARVANLVSQVATLPAFLDCYELDCCLARAVGR